MPIFSVFILLILNVPTVKLFSFFFVSVFSFLFFPLFHFKAHMFLFAGLLLLFV